MMRNMRDRLGMEMATSIVDTLTPEMMKVVAIFHPDTTNKVLAAHHGKTRFVHYTNADTAMRIIRNEEVWLRKSTVMNDFSELQHGFQCLQSAYSNHKDRYVAVVESIFPGLVKKLEDLFNVWKPVFEESTFMTCVSEHDADEDITGRLSMWRAYGGASGVALVMHGTPFHNVTDALAAYTYPVLYQTLQGFDARFAKLLDDLESNASLLQSLGEEAFKNSMFEVFRTAMLCTKHPGFKEEREWRIIYIPTFSTSKHSRRDIETIGGVPQPVCKLPLRNIPDEGLEGIEIREVIERIIIGPTQFPREIFEALSSSLIDRGLEQNDQRIVISDIPLRT